MGTIIHDAAVVTFLDWDNRRQQVLEMVKTLNERYNQRFNRSEIHGPPRSLFVVSDVVTNGYFSVVMFPDGSKEGWDTSNFCNELRQSFALFAKSLHAEGVHVRYGECSLETSEL